MKTMKAIFKTKNEKPKLVEIPVPEPKENEALIKVNYAGICKTDLKVASGNLACKSGGVVLGHEFSGTIEKFGKPGRWAIGDLNIGSKVTVDPMLDDETDAMLGKDINGCFAEYVAVDISNIIQLPKSMHRSNQMKIAAYTEPVAAAFGAIDAIDALGCIDSDDIIIAGDPNDRIAKLLAKCLFLEVGIRPAIKTPERLLLEYDLDPNENLHDIIVECCPNHAGKLLKCLRNRGILVLKSRGYVPFETDLQLNDIVMKELKIIGAKYRNFPSVVSDILNLYFNEFKGMISSKDFALKDFKKAFEDASAKDSKKIMFKCAQ